MAGIGEDARELWTRARSDADGRRERFGSVHLLASLAEGRGAVARLLSAHGVTGRSVRLKTRDFLDEPGAALRQVEAAAERLARSAHARQTAPIHILAALLRATESSAFRLLGASGTDMAALHAAALGHISGSSRWRSGASARTGSDDAPADLPAPAALPRLLDRTPPGVHPDPGPPAGSGRDSGAPKRLPEAPPARRPVVPLPLPLPLPPAAARRPQPAPRRASPQPLDAAKCPFLAAHGRDLVRAASEGKLDPAVARDDVVDRMLDVLQKRRGSSVCLVGPPGVGKTSALHALAGRLAAAASGCTRLIEISPATLWAGATLRGALAERILQVAEDARRIGGRVALVVGDAAQFVRSVSESGEGADDALREALDSRSFALVGEAAADAWDRAARQHPALARCFTTVDVSEPDKDATVRMLRAVAPRYAEHHGVEIGEEAVEAAARIARRYLSGRALPDRAVQLVDLASARARRDGLARTGGTEVAAVASDLADVPADRLLAADGERLLAIEEEISRRIVGHREAISRIADVLRRNAAGFRSGRPIGSLLFLGPTGVGKTETARAIAECLFPGRENLLRLDMSEYSEPHAVARLVGAPPGYVGFESSGMLAEALRRRPYQVVLLDEFEKAHPDVHRVFLQVLEDGRLTDGQGRRIDFSNTVVVMTSNLGSDLFGSRRPVGFGRDDPHPAAEEAVRTARRTLPPELWNRIDETLVFMPLDREEIERIARMLLDSTLAAAASGRKITLEYDAAVPAALLDAGGYDPAFGARPMRRTIQRLVEAPLARVLLRADLPPDAVLRLRVSDGRVVVERHAPPGFLEAVNAS